MHYLLAIDQGTSSTRARLYTLQGKLVQSSQQALAQYYTHSGWVEQDPEEIWQTTLNVMQEVCAAIDPIHILACGITT
jgi:glycerol kinase